jgi:hypothetical protein
MDANRIAGWLLELVTSPERASAIVGDFAEESADSRFWFWRQIAQTLVALIVREFTSAGPGLILKCVLRSFAYLYVAVATGTMIASLAWYKLAAEQTLPNGMRFVPAVPIFLGVSLAMPLFLRAGWLLAERTKRPFAAASIFTLVIFFAARNPNEVPYAPWISLLGLIGAIWQRRRSLRTT